MFESIKRIFAAEGITRVGVIDINECDIINQRILPPDARKVIIFCLPYRSENDIECDGFSEYARIYDYHKYSSSLYSRIIELMVKETGDSFYGFCDHSPINEKLAAAKCGLGVIGRNSLFIDNVYGSFVFLGSVLTNADLNSDVHAIVSCINCGKCVNACPNSAINDNGIDRLKCLSGISQKKNKTDEEKQLLKKHNIAWGCDICQLVCPYNDKELSPIPYFKETRIKNIDARFIESLSDEEFNRYAFSYKGRKIVLDNIDILT